jgi:hypothetical protein
LDRIMPRVPLSLCLALSLARARAVCVCLLALCLQSVGLGVCESAREWCVCPSARVCGTAVREINIFRCGASMGDK